MTVYEKSTLILQAVVAVSAFVSVYLVLRQLRAMSVQIEATQHASEAQSIISIVNFLQTAEARDARTAVRSTLSKSHHDAWDETQKRDAASVCANYDVVAALLKAGLIRNKHVIVDNWAPSIKHCHQVLSPFIDAKRRAPGSDPKYWNNFDWLKAECDQRRA
ncbi:DUF4760 domain-containing protein [Alicycliphilus denitrificans]|uniref:DUF4760 domain-containing protein n=1 Tax=Alicycliphilus denitrificans TaxID=179636 RepID=UPI0016041F3C|nr:hypothetical protein [Alicycliphilus denitrificans]